MTETIDTATVHQLTEEGRALIDLIKVDPAERSNMDFDKSIQIVRIAREPLHYTIDAELPRKLTACTSCGSSSLMRHGRYVVRLADLPYQDPTGFVMPVQYAIKAQRYKCSDCGLGDVEQLPQQLTPFLTSARITRRLSIWLLFAMQTQMPYDAIARMTGYSKVWHRKWFHEVRTKTALPPKPQNKPGRRKKAEGR